MPTQLSSHLIAYDNNKIICSMVNMFHHTYLHSSFLLPSTTKTSPLLNHDNQRYSTNLDREKSFTYTVLFQKPISFFLSYIVSFRTMYRLSNFYQIIESLKAVKYTGIIYNFLKLHKQKSLNINRTWNKPQMYLQNLKQYRIRFNFLIQKKKKKSKNQLSYLPTSKKCIHC